MRITIQFIKERTNPGNKRILICWRKRTKNKKVYSSICASSRCVKNVRKKARILYSLRGHICYYILFYFSVFSSILQIRILLFLRFSSVAKLKMRTKQCGRKRGRGRNELAVLIDYRLLLWISSSVFDNISLNIMVLD